MKIPRLTRSRSASAGRPLLSRDRVKWLVLGFALLILSFVVGFYLLFPTLALQERIEREFRQQTGASLTMADLSLGFPPALNAEKVVVSGIPGRDRLDVDRLNIAPLWHSLPGGNPGIRYRADLFGGTVTGEAREEGELAAEAQQVSIDEPLGGGTALRIAGVLRQGDFQGAVPLQTDTETRISLVFDEVRVAGMEGMGVEGGALPLGTVALEGSGTGKALKIDRLSAEGGALQISGRGSFLIANPAERSRINLTLELQPTPALDPNLRDLLDLFARPSGNGGYRLRITGTLGSPIFAK